jgi:AraC-like DNA-binding protein
MGDQAHFLANLIFSVVSGVMALSFLAHPTARKVELRNYRISLRVLSGAFIAMALLTLAVLIFNLSDNSRELFTFLTLFISATQAFLFTFTLITLFNPRFITLSYLCYQLLPFVVITLAYVISYLFFGDPIISDFGVLVHKILHPTVFIRLLFVLLYVFQLVYYSSLFFREEHKYKEELDNYFSEPVTLQLSWVRYAFGSALIIGTLSLVSDFFASKIYDVFFTALFTLYYLVFAIEYIKYNNIYTIVEPALKKENPVVVELTATEPKKKWVLMKKRIIMEKYYLKERVNIEDMAQWLHIGRTTLSNYINQEEKVNFNSWINSLRVEEAKRLMCESPNLTIMNISQLTGYSEQANFSRQFKQITGESPLLWKKQQLANG